MSTATLTEKVPGGYIRLQRDGYYQCSREGNAKAVGQSRAGLENRFRSREKALAWLAPVDIADPVLNYVRSMRRDDTRNPGPSGSTYRRGGSVVFKQADEMPEGMAAGEFKRAGLSGGEYLEALIKEFAARFDGQEPLAVNVAVTSPFLDALAEALEIEVIHV